MEEIKILELDYYEALSISSDDDFQIHFKREPSACFINSHFVEGLQAWEANIDIKFISSQSQNQNYTMIVSQFYWMMN